MIRPNVSGNSTPTHSLHESSSDPLESDQPVEVRPIRGQLPSTSRIDQFDSNQNHDFPSTQNRSVRNPVSVVQRLSSLMAIKNNVSYLGF